MNYQIIKKQPYQVKGYNKYTLNIIDKKTGNNFEFISSKIGFELEQDINSLLSILI